MSLGSLLLLDWFVVELVLMGYCLFDVFYHPTLVQPKNALTHVTQQSDVKPQQPIMLVKTPVEYMCNAELLVLNCFDTLPPRDTTPLRTRLTSDTLKIYDIDSVDVKPDMGDAYPVAISTLQHFLPIDYAMDTVKFTILIDIDSNCNISDVSLLPYQGHYNILLEQLQLVLLKTKVKSAALYNGKAVACQYRMPVYISMK